jgi:RNA polymerase sigma-70 factor (ECF subfamily)
MEPKSQSSPRRGRTDTTSLSLLVRVKAQDAAAWQRLVDLYSPLLLSWFRRCGLDGEDANDLLQEVFKAVAANIARFRRQRPGDTFRGWLRVVARNQIRLHFRREAHRPRATGGTTAQARLQELPDEDVDDADSSDAQDASDLFCRGLELIRSEFEDRTWRAFWLLVVEGRSSDDVCREFQMTPGALRQAKYKVLRRLRAELGDVLE